MGRKKKIAEDGTELPDAPDALVKVRFLKTWSADRGLFRPDDEKKGEYELPEDLAESLMAEGVVEVL